MQNYQAVFFRFAPLNTGKYTEHPPCLTAGRVSDASLFFIANDPQPIRLQLPEALVTLGTDLFGRKRGELFQTALHEIPHCRNRLLGVFVCGTRPL